MSVSSYQNEVSRLQKDIGDLRSQIASKNKQIASINQDIASAIRSISSSSSSSSLQSALSRQTSKQQEGARITQTLSDLEKRLGSKMSDLSRAQTNLTRAQEQEAKKQETDSKKRENDEKKRAEDQKRRTDEQLKRAKEVTRQFEKQSALQSHLKRQAMLDVANLPTKIKVLFCAADPKNEDRLFLDEEVRSITERIRASKHRDSVDLVSIWAVRSGDLIQALNEHEPHIVHFSGHGSDEDDIVFLDSAGNSKFVSKTAIVQILASAAANLRVVVFNTCFSENQAKDITQHIEAAIGTSASISDDAARNFSAQFYSAIGFGLSIQQAYDQAKAFLMAENDQEAQTPVLFTQEGVDAKEIILVKPS